MAKILQSNLSKLSLVIFQHNFFIDDLGSAVFSGNIFKLNSSPCRKRVGINFLKQNLRAPSQGNKSNSHFIEFVQISVGCKFLIKDYFFWVAASSFLPILNET